MPVNIYIQDEHVGFLIEFFNSKLKSIKEQKNELEKEESSIKASIAQLKSKKSESVSADIKIAMPLIENNDKEFNSDWIWVRKIEFAIKDLGQPSTTSEIVDRIILYEPALDRKKAIASVSSNLSVKSGAPEDNKSFIKIDDGTRVSKYFIQMPLHDNVQVDAEDAKDTLPKPEINDLPF